MTATGVMENVDALNVRPETVYFGPAHGVCGMLYRPTVPASATVVLVEPFGIEALAAEATLRSLTLALLKSGLAVLRVAALDAGDSADLGQAASIVSPWIAGVNAAVQLARTVTDGEVVDVVGLRLGATIAAYATRESPVRKLVLWAPVSGKAFVREFKMLGAAGASANVGSTPRFPKVSDTAPGNFPAGTGVLDQTPGPLLEAGGFALSSSSVAELAGVDLRSIEGVGADQVLLVDRDDLRVVDKVLQHLNATGASCTTLRPPGYVDMRLDDPEEGQVPEECVRELVSWIAPESVNSSSDARRDGHDSSFGSEAELETGAVALSRVAKTENVEPCRSPSVGVLELEIDGVALEEHPLWLQANGAALYCVLTIRSDLQRSEDEPCGGLPTVVMLTTGSNPRCGAGRVQAKAARSLAVAGHPVVRFDRRGIGASLLTRRDGTVIFDPCLQVTFDAYDPVHVADAEFVVDELARRHGYTDFALVGMCSGAYTAFHLAGTNRRGRPQVRVAVMINQILFMDLLWSTKEESPAMAVKAGYELRNGWRDIRKWKSLLSGSISVRKTVSRLVRLGKMRTCMVATAVLERSGLREPRELAMQLQRIADCGVEQRYIFDDAETGLGFLHIESGRAVRRLSGAGKLSVTTVAGAGHIFASTASQRWLERQLLDLLSKHG